MLRSLWRLIIGILSGIAFVIFVGIFVGIVDKGLFGDREFIGVLNPRSELIALALLATIWLTHFSHNR